MSYTPSRHVYAEFSLGDYGSALDRVTDAIKRELAILPGQTADAVVARMRAIYPVGPVHTGRTFSRRTGWGALRSIGGGTLRDSVTRVTPRRTSVTPGGENIPIAVVRALAPHVHFWQEGTRDRRDPTRPSPKTGAGAWRGRMPAAPKGLWFESVAGEERAAMERTAEAILNRTWEL